MRKSLFLWVIIGFLILQCQPATEITGSWKNTDASARTSDVSTILVTALSARTHVRQTVEQDLAKALSDAGYTATKSFDILPPFTEGNTPDKEELFSKIDESGVNAILTVALIDEGTENRYVPGNIGYAPMPRFGYYGTFWGYYNNWFPTLASPGYYEEDKVYFIETNLYDVESEQLLWSGQSETVNPGSLKKFSEEFAEIVVSELRDQGVLQPTQNEGIARERTNEK